MSVHVSISRCQWPALGQWRGAGFAAGGPLSVILVTEIKAAPWIADPQPTCHDAKGLPKVIMQKGSPMVRRHGKETLTRVAEG